jgi:hypothetical protein
MCVCSFLQQFVFPTCLLACLSSCLLAFLLAFAGLVLTRLLLLVLVRRGLSLLLETPLQCALAFSGFSRLDGWLVAPCPFPPEEGLSFEGRSHGVLFGQAPPFAKSVSVLARFGRPANATSVAKAAATVAAAQQQRQQQQ